jgi:hypothetical protein
MFLNAIKLMIEPVKFSSCIFLDYFDLVNKYFTLSSSNYEFITFEDISVT